MRNRWKTMTDEELRQKCIELGARHMQSVKSSHTNIETKFRIEKALEDTREYRFNNRLRKSIFGIYEFGKYNKGTHKLEYEKWSDMLYRVFSPEAHMRAPTYKGCTVSDLFQNFQQFCEWYVKQIGYGKNFQLDKDLLVKNNRYYSENTCVLVPQEINISLIRSNKIRGDCPIGVHKASRNKNRFEAGIKKYGKMCHLGTFSSPEEAFHAYKAAKEAHLKELAEKWKTEIDPRAYNALLNYQVEIDD